jgi:hypothetical protein
MPRRGWVAQLLSPNFVLPPPELSLPALGALFACEACSMSRGNAPKKTASAKPLFRRPFSKRRVASALAVARNAGMAVRGLKIGANGEIDLVFGKPAEDEAEDLTKRL